jgi:hypothetical protein
MPGPFVVTAEGSHPAPPDLPEIRRAFRVLFDPEALHEIRALPSGRFCYVRPDAPNGPDAVAPLADEKGLYYSLNPVSPDAVSHCCRNGDILRRRWFLVDVDPVKADRDSSSTEAEKDAAGAVQLGIVLDLNTRGWPAPVLLDSGNGYHLLYRVDLPNDEPSRDLIRDALKALAAKHDTPGATVDKGVHNAARISKLPGSWARKGPDTPARPHRLARLVSAPDPIGIVSADQLRALGMSPDSRSKPDPPPADAGSPFVVEATDGGRESAYVRAAVEAEIHRVEAAPEGERNTTLNDASFRLATLLNTGHITRGELEAILLQAAVKAGLPAEEARKTIKSGLDAGAAKPRDIPDPKDKGPSTSRRAPEPGDPDYDPDLHRDATVADLRRVMDATAWVWEKWIPNAALTLLASESGTGKTRFCFDLHRRVLKGLGWPDGTPTPDPKTGKVLWVAADNQYQEMCDISREFGIPDDLVMLNSTVADPYDGTSLQGADELADFQARIKRIKPMWAVIDTITNTGDFKSHDSADAKRQYKPLQEIATRCRVPIICVTHLNAAGKTLGRRPNEKVRVVIQLDYPDPDGQWARRKLWVPKSKAVRPDPLGVTMGDLGNEYDTHPPVAPDGPFTGATAGMDKSPKLKAAAGWLKTRLNGCALRVRDLCREAETAGIDAKTLFRAKDTLPIDEIETEGKKWWRFRIEE